MNGSRGQQVRYPPGTVGVLLGIQVFLWTGEKQELGAVLEGHCDMILFVAVRSQH